MPSDTILAVLISVFGTALFGPLALALFNRVFSRKKDSTDLAENALTIANQAVINLAQATARIHDLEKDMQAMKAQKTAPIHVEMTIYRDPELVLRDVKASFLAESEV